MFFSRHLNNMPIISPGSAFSLQLRYKYWLETVVLGLQRAYKNIDNSISMYSPGQKFCRMSGQK